MRSDLRPTIFIAGRLVHPYPPEIATGRMPQAMKPEVTDPGAAAPPCQRPFHVFDRLVVVQEHTLGVQPTLLP